jgi:hypothetical protein
MKMPSAHVMRLRVVVVAGWVERTCHALASSRGGWVVFSSKEITTVIAECACRTQGHQATSTIRWA